MVMFDVPPELYDESIDGVDTGPVLFEAVLEPFRSLTPSGFVIMMSAVAFISFVAGAVFMLLGTWPVIGFIGLDALLIFLAFRINYRHARMYETIRLTESALTVMRVHPDGRFMTWKFQPYWLKISKEDPPRTGSQLVLSSHGKALVIGEFLTPDERLDFADTLSFELRKLREFPVQAAE